MSGRALFAFLALVAGGPPPAAETAPSEGFLEYLGTFEPEDEATIVEFVLDGEERAEETQRPEEGREATEDDPA